MTDLYDEIRDLAVKKERKMIEVREKQIKRAKEIELKAANSVRA